MFKCHYFLNIFSSFRQLLTTFRLIIQYSIKFRRIINIIIDLVGRKELNLTSLFITGGGGVFVRGIFLASKI
jgi:hypothetical protein